MISTTMTTHSTSTFQSMNLLNPNQQAIIKLFLESKKKSTEYRRTTTSTLQNSDSAPPQTANILLITEGVIFVYMVAIFLAIITIRRFYRQSPSLPIRQELKKTQPIRYNLSLKDLRSV